MLLLKSRHTLSTIDIFHDSQKEFYPLCNAENRMFCTGSESLFIDYDVFKLFVKSDVVDFSGKRAIIIENDRSVYQRIS